MTMTVVAVHTILCLPGRRRALDQVTLPQHIDTPQGNNISTYRLKSYRHRVGIVEC
jgi:hypothetical protein